MSITFTFPVAAIASRMGSMTSSGTPAGAGCADAGGGCGWEDVEADGEVDGVGGASRASSSSMRCGRLSSVSSSSVR